MHELSIVQSLIGLCEKSAKKENASNISTIEIKIGKLSGIEPHLLESAYDVFKDDTICKNAKLIIHIQEIVVNCKDCGFDGILTKYEFQCPECKSTQLEIKDGEDMMLMRLEMS